MLLNSSVILDITGIDKQNGTRLITVPLIRPPMVHLLVESGLYSELFSLMKPIYIDNAFWYRNSSHNSEGEGGIYIERSK